jgi:acetoin utilization protein AcuB
MAFVSSKRRTTMPAGRRRPTKQLRSTRKKGARPSAKPLVSTFMSGAPQSIARSETLAAAHQVMRRHLIRHLPVVERGKLVGIVSQRDLYLMETLRDVDPADTPVEDAMTPDTYCVSSDTELGEVVRTMTRRKIGCAVVMKGRSVVGMFTTIDAMRALDHLLHTP